MPLTLAIRMADSRQGPSSTGIDCYFMDRQGGEISKMYGVGDISDFSEISGGVQKTGHSFTLQSSLSSILDFARL